jgi:hypothetical protein
LEKITDPKTRIDDKPHSQIFCQFLEDFIGHAARFGFGTDALRVYGPVLIDQDRHRFIFWNGLLG